MAACRRNSGSWSQSVRKSSQRLGMVVIVNGINGAVQASPNRFLSSSYVFRAFISWNAVIAAASSALMAATCSAVIAPTSRNADSSPVVSSSNTTSAPSLQFDSEANLPYDSDVDGIASLLSRKRLVGLSL